MFNWLRIFLGFDAKEKYDDSFNKLKDLYIRDKEKSEECSKEKNYFG